MLNMTQRVKHCNFLWCSVWLKEANTAILCEFEVDTDKLREASAAISCGETDKHCRLVLCWTRPRGELRWKRVKRWWDGCPGVVSTNGDIKGEGGGSRWAFVQIPAVRWAHVRLVGFFSGGLLFPCPAEYIRRKINCFYLDMNPNSSPPLLRRCFTEVCQSVWLGYSISSVEFGPYKQPLMTLTL